MTDTLVDRVIKTRRPHLCWWCGERIDFGQWARFITDVDEGVFYKTWAHMECDKAIQSIKRSSIPEDGYPEHGHKRGTTEEI